MGQRKNAAFVPHDSFKTPHLNDNFMDCWLILRKYTEARIGLHRIGHAISTKELLELKLAQGLAHDAVKAEWNLSGFDKKLKKVGEKPLKVRSEINSKEQYLRFPNLGKILNKSDYKKLSDRSKKSSVDIAFIMTDGLSPKAADAHMIPFWLIFKKMFTKRLNDLKIVLVLVPFGRVALSDEIGRALKAKVSVILVGERPGLSAFDSLGIYLTYGPKAGNTDANRNCISNIHPPQGLNYEEAAEQLIDLLGKALRLKLSGVNLKPDYTHIIEHHT